MPTPAYMTITGATQGELNSGAMGPESVGTFSKSGYADFIQVTAFDLGIERPVNPDDGQPTGRRRHMGFKVTKIIDKTTPQLMQAIAKGEECTVVIEWYRTSKEGTEELYYKMEFTGATVVDRRVWMPNTLDPEKKDFWHMEDLSFSYKKVTETHEVAGTSGEDDAEA